MPEVLGLKNTENYFKRRVTGLMKKTYYDDRSIGATIPTASSVDDLMKVLEELESLGTVLISQLEVQEKHETDPITNEFIVRFYMLVKRTLSETKRLDFTKVPRLDVESVQSYLASLKTIYESLDRLFKNIIVRISKAFPELRNKKVKDPEYYEQFYQGVQRDLDTEIMYNKKDIDNLQRQLDEVNATIAQVEALIEQKEQAIFRNVQAGLTTKKGSSRLEQDLKLMYAEAEGLDQRKEDLENTLARRRNIETEYDRELEELPSGTEVQAQKLSIMEANKQLSLVEHPERLIMENFATLLATLENGIVRYNAGLTGRLNKIEVETRLPISEPTRMEGGRRYSMMGAIHQNVHKRFL